jgi:hypothetical protein
LTFQIQNNDQSLRSQFAFALFDEFVNIITMQQQQQQIFTSELHATSNHDLTVLKISFKVYTTTLITKNNNEQQRTKTQRTGSQPSQTQAAFSQRNTAN